MFNIEPQLSAFASIPLQEIGAVQLMNRVDTKYAIAVQDLPALLTQLQDHYKIVDVNGLRVPTYKSLYFDDDNFSFYKAHHNGKQERFKVRIRNYVESGLYFLEVKHRLKGRVEKKRIAIDGFEEELSTVSRDFVGEIIAQVGDLNPSMYNQYRRITLVNLKEMERLTIDLDLSFAFRETTKKFENLVIIELKQASLQRRGKINEVMREQNVRPYRLSKYCIGSLAIYGGKLKHNMFKEKLIQIEKINEKYR